MLFSEKETPEAWDPAFSPQVPRQYECTYTTRKVLCLKSVVLTLKEGGQVDEEEDEEEDSDDDGSDGNEIEGKTIKTEVGVGF